MHKKTGKKPHYRGKSGCINLPYGWKWTEGNKTIVKDPQEQKNIALGRQLRHKGLSLSQIKAQFEARNVLNRAQDASWTPESIRILLTRDVLTPKWQLRKDRMDARLRAQKKTKREARPAPVVALNEPDPVKWGQGHLVNRDGSRRAYWPHQVEDLRAQDENIIHLDGRDVGKTADLSTLALHYALATNKGTGLIAASLNGQLLSILEEIQFQIEQNPKLDSSIAVSKNGRRKFQRLPYPRIEFTNASVLYFRSAGTYGEAFRGLHVDRIWVDEGAWLSEEAWRALRQCLRTGGKMRVYSTPNGLRNTTYYRLTESARWRVFRWPSWINPTWTQEHETDLLEFYGGRGSAGWQHEVAGEHGAVSYGAFSPECFDRCIRDVLDYRKVVITGAELADCSTEEDTANRLEMLLNVGVQDGTFWIGADLGYTRDPTEILVFRQTKPENLQSAQPAIGNRQSAIENPQSAICNRQSPTPPAFLPTVYSLPPTVCSLVLRVHMESVSYPRIAQCLAILDGAYSPAGIGVDNGGNGVAVVQELLTLDKYRPRAFSGRLHGFDFGGVTQIPLPDGSEARKRTKELMTSLINGALQRRELVFPAEDRDLADQFLTQTYTLTNGIVVYSKGNDHIIDAVRCMMLAREKTGADWFDDATPVRPPLPLMFETFGGEEEREREYWSEHRMRFFIRE